MSGDCVGIVQWLFTLIELFMKICLYFFSIFETLGIKSIHTFYVQLMNNLCATQVQSISNQVSVFGLVDETVLIS